MSKTIFLSTSLKSGISSGISSCINSNSGSNSTWLGYWGGVSWGPWSGCRVIPCCLVLAPHPTCCHQLLLLGGPPLHAQSLLPVLVGVSYQRLVAGRPLLRMAGLLDISGEGWELALGYSVVSQVEWGLCWEHRVDMDWSCDGGQKPIFIVALIPFIMVM